MSAEVCHWSWIDYLPAPALVADQTRTIVAANSELARLSGYTVDTLIRVPIERLLPNEEPPSGLNRAVAASSPLKASIEHEGRLQTRGASTVEVSAQLSRFKDKGDELTLLVIRPRSVGESPAVEQPSDSLRRMISGLSHEMATPLGNARITVGSVRAAVDAFRAIPAGELTERRLQRFVERIDEASRLLNANISRATGLLESFKEFSSDRVSTRRRDFELADFLSEIGWTMTPRVEAAGHRLEIQGEAAVLLTSRPGALGQVLANLIENSVKHAHTQPGGLIRLVGKRQSVDQVSIRVSDDGKGVDPSIAGKIFEPFFSTAMGQGGSGLGLSIVRNIVETTLGGRVHTVASDDGAVFELILPVVAPPQASARQLIHE